MSTQAYREWVARGRPWKMAQPVAELVVWSSAAGVPLLGTLGNEDHLQKDEPEDHTPFSTTEWPIQLAGDVVCAIDLGNVRLLGPKIEAQARAGRLPWLKYMNHSGRHIDFRYGTPRTSTSRDEHVHLSIRTDWASRTIGRFDPWGTTGIEDDMPTPDDLMRADCTPWDPTRTYTVGGALYDSATRGKETRDGVVALAAEVTQLRDELAALAARPAVQLDRATLVDVLTEVIGKVDGR